MRRILIFLMIAALSCACNNEYLEVEEEMKGCEEIGLWVKGEQVFKYSDKLCQYSWNPETKQFTAFTDSVADWFSVSMDSEPYETDDKVTAAISWTTKSDIKTRKDVELKVIRTEKQKIWLWSRKAGTGAIVEIIK